MMRIWVLGAVVVAAGCGGGGSGGGSNGGGGGIDPRLSRIDIYETQRLRVLGEPGAGVMGMPITDDAQMPINGRATYDGSASILIETMPETALIVGDATVVMDFDLNEVSGEMGRFIGTDLNGDFRNFDGRLVIEDGDIGGTAANAWSLDYAGTLSVPGQAYVMAGTMEGEFLGAAAGAIAGLELEAQIVANGVLSDGVVTLIGEGDVIPDE